MPEGEQRGFSPALRIILMGVSLWLLFLGPYFLGLKGFTAAVLLIALFVLLDMVI